MHTQIYFVSFSSLLSVHPLFDFKELKSSGSSGVAFVQEAVYVLKITSSLQLLLVVIWIRVAPIGSFEYMITKSGTTWERLRGVALLEWVWPYWRKYVTRGGLWGFKTTNQAQYCSLPAACRSRCRTLRFLQHRIHLMSPCSPPWW